MKESLHDYPRKSDNIKLEFWYFKSVEEVDKDNHTNLTSFSRITILPDDVVKKKSGHFSSEEKDWKTESAQFFSEDKESWFWRC